jgi:2-amino-4-hydroxy-6-hydroxymethyldihydropteridine diphosphokinase
MIKNVFIALGSNIGDRQANLEKARSSFDPEIEILQCSSVYKTPPWGYFDQPVFLNQVCECGTRLEPLDLLNYLKGIEKEMGRELSFLYGPRLIDLDILFYDQLVVDYPNLSIPHPHIEKRAFVLVPLMDIAPEFCHPATGVTVQDMYHKVDTQGIKKISVCRNFMGE